MKAFYSILVLAALTAGASCLFRRKYIYVKMALSWTDAQTYCRRNYVDLSTIQTSEELDTFRSDAVGYLSEWCWIGLRKAPESEIYTQWSDGSALGLTKWGAGEPMDTKTEHCVLTCFSEWYDFLCTDELNFFCYTWEPQMILIQEMKTWEEALMHCRTFYTDLISLSHDTDQFAVNNTKTQSFWTGLRFLAGSWFWVNKESLTNLDSLPSCPALPFHCGAKTAASVLANRDCGEKMRFMCYRITE